MNDIQGKPFRYLKDLHPWDKNPRSISKTGFERLKKQLQRLGQYKPLIITPDNIVLGGNMRLRAYKALNIDPVWVSVVNPKNENERLEYALSDNDRAGFYDEDLLANLTSEYQDFNWGDYAADLGEPTNLGELIQDLSQDSIEDEAPEVSTDLAISKLGEVYQLGRHRLMCGDSTDAGSVALLMNGQRADFGFCDPPYNLGFEYHSYDDNKTDKEYREFTYKWFYQLHQYTERQCITLGTKNIKLSLEMDALLAGVACWVKKNWITACHIAKLQQWEPIVFYGDYTRHKRESDLFEINRVEQKDVGKDHTCPKQIALILEIVKNYSDKAVLDLFGGSGTTLIACEQTGRTCYMLELDAKYVDVIRKRYWKFTHNNNEEGWQEGTKAM